jgi:hypothetical protein
MNKSIYKYILPISALVASGGLFLCIILADDKRWLDDSISYLGTKPRCTLSFAIWILTSCCLNFIFLFNSIRFIRRVILKNKNNNYQSISIMGSFTLAFLSLIVAGFIPFTKRYVLHIFCGFFFFSLYPVGILLLSIWVWDKLRNFSKFSTILIIVYLTLVTFFKLYYISYVPFEIAALLLICVWNIALNKTVLTLKAKGYK